MLPPSNPAPASGGSNHLGALQRALLAIALAFGGGAAAQSEPAGLLPAPPVLEHCVEHFEFPLQAVTAPRKAALASSDIGNITVIAYDGDYSRGLDLPRVEVAQRFYQEHADAYDFLIVFTTFEFATGNALAFYNGVRNDVEGIGQEPYDVSANLGSGGRLQGYIDMAATSRYDFNTRNRAFATPLGTLSHEIMHRWGVYPSYRTAGGAGSTALIGRDGAHWSLLADTGASVMYGAAWEETAPGQFRIVDARQRFGPWDMYLAGLADASEVPPIRLIQGSTLNPSDLPVVGTETSGSFQSIAISQVVAAEGARVPAAADAQRDFTAALVLLHRPGEDVDPALLAQLERFRISFESYFQSITHGRANIAIGNFGQHTAASIAPPAPLAGSSSPAPAAPLASAVAWLKLQQQADGSWQDRPGTAVRDTALAHAAIAQVEPEWPGLAAARAWLDGRTLRNSDSAAWRVMASDVAALGDIELLTPAARDGIGVRAGWQPATLDSALALRSHAERGALGEQAATRLGNFLRTTQHADGSFPNAIVGPASVRTSVSAARALLRAAVPEHAAAGAAARDWLVQRFDLAPQNASIGEAAELLHHAGALDLPALLRADLLAGLLARQGNAGDWSGSVYTTAVATLAVALQSQPNYQLGAAATIPTMPVLGEPVTLRVRVRNTGGQSAPATTLQWFRDGAPGEGGTPVGAAFAVPVLLAGEVLTVDVPVESSLVGDATLLVAAIDLSDTVVESNEDDNRATVELDIIPPHAGVDAALYASDATLTPASFTSIGQHVELSGTVRNLGTDATADLRLVLYRVVGGARTALADTTLALPAGGNAPFSLGFDVTQLGAHRLELVADPDDNIDEANEANNLLNFDLPYGDAVDLALTQADVATEPSLPAFGDDVRVRATVRNPGTRASAATQIVLERDNGGTWERLQSLPLSVPAAGTAEREFLWRPERAGEHVLRVVVDPDNVVAELDEANNTVGLTLMLSSGDEENLVVVPGSLQFDPDPPREGRAFAVSAMLRNLGRNAAAGFNVGLYFGDPRASGVRLAVQRFDGGLAGESETAITLDVPDFPVAGDVSLFVFVDSDLEIAERSETDNIGIREAIALKLPDLEVTQGAVTLDPPSPVIGQSVRATVDVSNTGEQASEAALVRLFERAGQERSEIAPPATLPALQPGVTHTLAWEWTFGQAAGADALTVSVDPDNAQREGDELNNEVTVLLTTQNGDYFVSEPFFSPNGDGVRDRTTAFFVLPPADIATVLVRDAFDRPVADLAAFLHADADRVSAVWDGRDERGAIAPDGRYVLFAQRSDGSIAASVDVVLDVNSPMALEAVNTDRAVLRNLPPSANPWHRAPAGSLAEDYVYAIGSESNESEATKRGVFRSHVLMGGQEIALSRRWLDRYAAANDLDSIDVEHLALGLAHGKLLMLLRERPETGPERVVLWTQDALAVDNPVRVFEVPSTYWYGAEILGSFDSERVIVGSSYVYGEDERWLVDLAAGSATVLRRPEDHQEIMRVYPEGIVYGSGGDSSLRFPRYFVPADTLQPIVQFDPEAETWDCMVRMQFQPDAPRVLMHVQRYGQEYVDLIDMRSGNKRRLAEGTLEDSDCGGGGEQVERAAADAASDATGKDTKGEGGSNWLEDGEDIALFRAFWLERQNEIWVLDHESDRMLRFNASGDPLSAVNLPGPMRQGEYGEFGSFTEPQVSRAEVINPSWMCGEGQIVPSWGEIARADGFERATYDPAGRAFYVARGEAVTGGDSYSGNAETCEGATEFQRVGLDGSAEFMAGMTRWPLSDAVDRERYPQAVLEQIGEGEGGGERVLLPEAWPRFIHRNSTLLRRDGRVQFADGSLTRPWNQAWRLQRAWPGESRLQLGDRYQEAFKAVGDGEGERFDAVFSTLDRMSIVLRASSDGRGVRLSGIATDGNFERFSIDYAHAATPEAWLTLIPATREEVIFDDFMTWAPPAAGAYVFRLTVVDRAGNLQRRYASAEVQFGSPIVNLRQNHRAISPNGDGVQDALGLTFTVVRPTEQRFRVIDEAARVVFEQNLVYGTPELGPQSWSWDGRTTQGAVAPNGRYRVELSAGFQLSTLLDTVAPTLNGSQRPSYVPVDYGFDYCTDDYYGTRRSVSMSAQVQRRRVGDAEWIDWLALGRCNPEGPQPLLQALHRSDQLQFQYRLVAGDTAGNRTELEFAPPQDVFALITADLGSTFKPARWQTQPFESATAATIPQHMKPQPPPYSEVPTVLYPGPGVPVYFTSERPLFGDEALIDLAVVDRDDMQAPLAWQTIAAAVPQPAGEHVYSVDVDLTLFHDKLVALRVRSHAGAGGTLESNAFLFQVGGVVPGCVMPGRGFSIGANLLHTQRDPVLDVALAGPGTPMIRVQESDLEFTSGSYQYMVPLSVEIPSTANFSVKDGRGREMRITFPVQWCELPPGSGDGPGDAKLKVAPVVAEACDVTPTQQIHVVPDLPIAVGSYRLNLHDPLQSAPIVIAEGSIADLPEEGFFLSTAGLPEGETQVSIDYAEPDGAWAKASKYFPVDRTAPPVALFQPAPGSRVCPDAMGGLSIEGDIFTDTRMEYHVEAAFGGGQPLAYDNIGCSFQGQQSIGGGGNECRRDLLETIDSPPDQSPSSGEFARIEAGVMQIDEQVTFRLRASDWSGAQMCATSAVHVDFNARFEERSAPEPNVQAQNPQGVAVSTLPAAEHRIARWFFLAREPLHVTGDLYRAERVGNRYEIVEDPLARVYEQNGLNGAFDPFWDATGSGYEDGVYGVLFTATDECGNTKNLVRFLTLDSTPPEFDVLRPLEGAQLRVATVEVFGSVVDTLFQNYEIGVGSGASGPWVQLADGNAAVPVPRVLAQWQTLGEIGQRWLRLTSVDRVGNRTERTIPFELLPRPLIMDGARTVPPLFSPNDDGVLDVSEVEIALRRAAALQIVLSDAQGAPVRTLEAGLEAQPGLVRVPWNGLGAATVVPDGDYTVAIAATDLEIPGNVDELELTVTVDNTPPALSAIEPAAGGFASCDGVATFTVDDPHLQEYDATLMHGNGGIVASAAGRVGDVVDLASLEALAEGDYRLEIRALDAAGNRVEEIRSFTLDCTPPDVLLSAPVDGSVVPRVEGRSTDITGSVQDPHLEGYSLVAVLDDGSEAQFPVATGTEAVLDGLLHRWSPLIDDGYYRLVLKARDRAGNEAETAIYVAIDGTPPIARIDQPASGERLNGELWLYGEATDDNFLEYRIDVASQADAAAGNWSTAFVGDEQVYLDSLAEFELVEQGLMYVRLTAKDLAGLEASHTIGVWVDSEPPPAPIALTAQTEGGINVRLNWQGGDAPDLAGFHVLREGQQITPDPVPLRTLLDLDVPEGEWRYVVHAVDEAGNWSEPSNVAIARVDRTPPEVMIHQPGNGETVRGELEVTGTAFSQNDFDHYELRLIEPGAGTDTLLHRGEAPVRASVLHRLDTRAFAEGTPLRLRLTGRDRSGNSAQDQVDIVVDNLPPAAPTGLVAVLQSPDVQVNWDPNSEPDLLGYLLYRNGSLVGFGGSLPHDLRPLSMPENNHLDESPPDGEIVYRVYAIDLAGNVSPPSAPASVERDEDPPHVEIVRPQDGLVFDEALEVAADSEERDIVQVQFAWRAEGDSTWIDLGGVLAERPWRTPFDPEALDIEYGRYQITAVATDAGGLTDPAPQVIVIEYADLTPPAPPQNLRARADGSVVNATWDANGEEDLAGYYLERLSADGVWERLNDMPLATTAFADSDRELGAHDYRVLAVDTYDNESLPSTESTAHVFEPSFEPEAYTPTAAVEVALAGIGGTRAGDGQLQIESPAGVRDLLPGPVPAYDPFVFAPVALDAGANDAHLRVLDAEGNRSIVASTRVTRGLLPDAPTDLSGSVAGTEVTLTWDASASADVAGYRLYRNGAVIAADTPLAQAVTAGEDGAPVTAAVDGNPATAWLRQADTLDDRLAGALDLEWTTPVLVGSLRLQWLDAARSARDFDIDGWFDGRWNTIATVRDHAGAARLVRLDTAYPTERLRLRPLRAQGFGREQALAEIVVETRVLTVGTTALDTPMDGRHVYEVAAVSALGFEGERSDAWTAEVGDAEAPPAVVLAGELDGRDALLSWTAADVPDLSHYALYRDGTPIAQVAAADPRTWRDAALANGAHRYVVHAVDAVGNAGPASNEVVLTLDGDVPGKPTIIRVTAQSGQPALQVDWIPGGGSTAMSYRLFHSHDRDGIGDPYRELVRQAATSYLHAGLTYGERVFYRVQAEDANGNLSELSDPVSGEVRNITTPAAPRLTSPTVPGRPLYLNTLRYDVCGIADADTLVYASVNGIESGNPASAVAADRVRAFATNEYGYSATLTPDGRSLLRTLSYGADVHRLDGPAAQTSSDTLYGGWRELQYNARGDVLYGLNWSSYIAFWETDQNWYSSFWLDVYSIHRFAMAEDERYVLVTGYRDSEHGLWLADRYGTPSVAIPHPDAFQIMRLLWAPDGRHAYAQSGNGAVHRIDIESRTSTPVVTGFGTLAEIDVSPRDGTLLYLRDEAGQSVLRTLQDGAPARELAQRSDAMLGAAWAPDGSQIALLFAQRLELIDPADGAVLRTISLEDQPVNSLYRLRWSESWRLLAYAPDSYEPAVVIDVAGRFCVRSLPAQDGINLVDAVSERASGVRSQRSLPIELEVYLGDDSLPDLSIQTSDIRFLPAAGEPGRSYSAVVTVRNRGNDSIENARGRATLIAPDGRTMPLPAFDELGDIDYDAKAYTLRLGTLEQSGEYRLQIELDPNDAVPEQDERNNFAVATLRLDVAGSADLSVAADSTTAAPGTAFAGDLAVAGATGFRGSVHLRITDEEGALVADVLEEAVGPLGFGTPWTRRWSWLPADGTLAGAYLLDAQLLDLEGRLVEAITLPLRIDAQSDIRLHLQPARTSAQIGDSVALQFGLDYPSGNQIVSNGELRVSAIDAAGGTTPLWQGPTGALLPGYVVRRSTLWPTLGAAPGTARVRLEFTAPGMAQQIEREVLLTQAPPAVLLSGALSVAPSPRLVLGDTSQTLQYRVDNAGAAALADVELRVAVRLEGAVDVLLSAEAHGPLAVGDALQGTLALDGLPQRPLAYFSTLEARPAGGEWRIVAQLGLASVDALAPDIVILSPDNARPHRSPALLASDIVDRHSRVSIAQYSLDGSEWRNLLAQGNRYESPLSGLADGPHGIVIRAVDTWGNERVSAPYTFVADSTPPVIDIDGVFDGQLTNIPPTPVVTATDAHPDRLSVWLNGEPFESGTTRTLDGEYTLTVLAMDRASNRSDAELRYTLDATPPPIAIVDPLDGAVVLDASVPVRVETEALAEVTLTRGVWQAQATADDAGVALFADVPLALGDNAISAVARDAATNLSAPAQISVERQGVGELTGSVLPAASSIPRGTALDATVSVDNDTADAFVALPLRLRVLGAGGETLASWTETVALARSETLTRPLDFATTAWPLGSVALELAATLDGDWQVLDTAAVAIVDGQAPTLTPLAPTAGALLRAPVALAASANDDVAVATVSYRIDGGGWSALTAVPASEEWRGQADLADGPHQVEFRAADAAGNTTTSPVIAFVVDNTPPQIVIAGVADGGLYGTAVQAEVSVLDAHPQSLTVTLNGAAYTSGTSINASGIYTLAATAVDAVGLSSERSIVFEVDLEPSIVSIVVPEDGAILTSATTPVSGLARPFANVTVVGETSTHSTTADADGRYVIDALDLAEGENRIVATATDRFDRVSPEAAVTVFRSTSNAFGLTGTLAATPTQLLAGDMLTLSYGVDEDAGVARSALPMRLSVRRAADPVALHEQTSSIDLAAGGSIADAVDLASTDWALGAHVAELDVQVDATWQRLATASFSVIDGGAPQAAFMAPDAGSYHATEAAVTVTASDTLGAIERVEVRVGEGGWIVLGAQARGTGAGDAGGAWSGIVPSPGDGPATLQARAFDDAGNASPVVSRAVIFDATPPLITIAGVIDGELRSAAVAPQIGVEDASPVQTVLLLDGAPYVSGTSVTADGEHAISVRSTDAAGNSAERAVAFAIDMTPPVVTIVSPATGTVMRSGQVDVLGRSEADVAIELVAGGFSASARTDASGSFSVPRVVLAMGDNRIAARATDRAGNVGAWSEVVVQRRGQGTLLGTLQAPDTLARGMMLDIDVTLANESDEAMALAPVRVVATLSIGREVELDSRDVALAERGDAAYSLRTNTRSWPAGTVTLRLFATLDGELQLASATLELTGDGGPPPVPTPAVIPATDAFWLFALALLIAAVVARRLHRRGTR